MNIIIITLNDTQNYHRLVFSPPTAGHLIPPSRLRHTMLLLIIRGRQCNVMTDSAALDIRRIKKSK